MGRLHISKVKPKTAKVLANTDLWDDGYHDNIKRAAQVLRNKYPRRDWLYVTQNDQGMTMWSGVRDSNIAMVSQDGRIQLRERH